MKKKEIVKIINNLEIGQETVFDFEITVNRHGYMFSVNYENEDYQYTAKKLIEWLWSKNPTVCDRMM